MTFMTCEIKQREKPAIYYIKRYLKTRAREYGRKNWALREKYARKIYRGKLPGYDYRYLKNVVLMHRSFKMNV